MHESPLASEIAIALNLVLDRGKTLVYQHCNAHDVENLKLIGHHVTVPFPFQVQS